MAIPGYEHIAGLSMRAFKKYNIFIDALEQGHNIDNPVKSKIIEEALKLNGPEVRALRALAWEKGDPVGSGAKGYYYARKSTEMKPVRDHIEARKNALIRDENHVNSIIYKFLDKEQYRLDLE